MAETKKAGAKGARNVQKAEPIVTAPNAAVEMADSVDTKPSLLSAAAPAPQPFEAVALFSSVRAQGDAFRQAMSEAVSVSAKGALEVNEKVIVAMQAQGEAALDLWRKAINTPPLPDALRTQTSATREAYEAASAQWKDVAESAARWFTKSLEPLQTVLHRRVR